MLRAVADTHGHALVIGVGADLPNTIDDAQGLAGILRDRERCAYPTDQVHLLSGPAANRDNILDELARLAQIDDREATVIFYFSGHGYNVTTATGEAYYLLPYGYDLDRLVSSAIRGKTLMDKLAAIPAKKLLVLLDCCHAGGIEVSKAPGTQFVKAPLPPEVPALLAQGRGRVIIASCRAGELSYAGKPYSAFTLALIEALAGVGAAVEDGFVRVADLALHGRQMVPRRTGNRQHPILNFEQADNFVLAYYAAGDAKPKGLPWTAEPQIEPQPGAFAGQGVEGSVVGGNIDTGGGDFIGRDKIIQGDEVRGDKIMGDKRI